MKSSQNRDDQNVLANLQKLLGPAVLLACEGKRPISKSWQRLTMADMTPKYLAGLGAHNIGVSLGEPSRGLVSADFDSDDSLRDFLTANPRLAGTLRTKGRRGGNLWFRVLGPLPRSTRLHNEEGGLVGEWRSTGNQTIIHGRHPDTGQAYRVINPVEPLTLAITEIAWPEAVKPRRWASLSESKRDCSAERAEAVEGTENSAEHLQDCRTAPLHYRPSIATAVSLIDEDVRFQRRFPERVIELYERMVALRYKAQPSARNDFITHAVPFLYLAVAESVLVEFSMHFYSSHRRIFKDSPTAHENETRAMLASASSNK